MRASVLELASRVVIEYDALEMACNDLRGIDQAHEHSSWTEHALAAQDAMGLATDSLRRCLSMVSRLQALTRAEVRRVRKLKDHHALSE
jgi:hypothetical protein